MQYEPDMSGLDILVSDPDFDLTLPEPPVATRPLVNDLSEQNTEQIPGRAKAADRGKPMVKVLAFATCAVLVAGIGSLAAHIAAGGNGQEPETPATVVQPEDDTSEETQPAKQREPDETPKEEPAKSEKSEPAEDKTVPAADTEDSGTADGNRSNETERQVQEEQQPRQENPDPHEGQTFVAERGHWEEFEVEPAYDEPVYVYLPTVTCSVCGKVDEDPDAHMASHADENVDASCTVSTKREEVDTIHHDAVTEQRWIVDVPAHWE